MRAFGLQASETSRVADVMAKSFSTSGLDLDKFTESMKLVAPIAKTAGISIETTTAFLGKMADVGISGSNAGTALRKIFGELGTEGSKLTNRLGFVVKNGDDAIRAFKQLSKEGVDLGAAQKLVGANAKKCFLSFSG